MRPVSLYALPLLMPLRRGALSLRNISSGRISAITQAQVSKTKGADLSRYVGKVRDDPGDCHGIYKLIRVVTGCRRKRKVEGKVHLVLPVQREPLHPEDHDKAPAISRLLFPVQLV